MLPTLILTALTSLSWSGPVKITAVEVSSEYTRSAHYPGRHIQDGKVTTAWVEGDSGSGVGSWLEASFDGPHDITHLKIWAGDWASRTAWERANRPAELEVKWSDGTRDTWTLADTWEPQVFAPEAPRRAERVHLRIKSIHSGTAFPDTAIAELQAFEAQAASGPLPIRDPSASSTYATDIDGAYPVEQVLDGLRDTYWCEGNSEGDGTGEWLEFRFDAVHTLQTLVLLNGIGTDASLHKTANVATTATLEFSDGSTQTVSLKPFFLPQKVPITPVSTSSVKITFTGIRRGTDYNDLCISEVQFLP
jgi:hypothetical protein